MGVTDPTGQVLYSLALWESARSEILKKMSDRQWLAAATRDLKSRYGVSLLDPEVDYVEVSLLLQFEEAATDSYLGMLTNKRDSMWDNKDVLLGENLRAFISANSKKKPSITFPWDQKKTKKMDAAVIKIQDAEKYFSNIKSTPKRSLAPPENSNLLNKE